MDIRWSPIHEDKFLTFGSQLDLFKVENIENVAAAALKGSGVQQISKNTAANLLAVNTDNQYMKCVSWYPRPNPDLLVAVGLATGKVVLTSLAKSGSSDPHKLIGKEFVPKYARQCNHLEWSPHEANLLAEGLDKHRSDSCVLVWDVHARPHPATDPRHRTASGVSKPLAEIGHQESSQSLSWFSRDVSTVVTGINNRFLRIYDLRDCTHPQSVAYTKAVHGVSIDPHMQFRLASFVENQVLVWDTRHFDKPVLTIPDHKAVSRVAWSPVRSGLLACLYKDSPMVTLYDIQQSLDGSDDLEPAVIERNIKPVFRSATSDPAGVAADRLSSFDWHHHHENRLLTVTAAGTVTDVTIFERMPCAFSPDLRVTWAAGRSLVTFDMVTPPGDDPVGHGDDLGDDVSVRIKRRALRGYGIQKDVKRNADLTDDPALKDLWGWLKHLRDLSEEAAAAEPAPASPPGRHLPPPPRPPPDLRGVHSRLRGGDTDTQQRSDVDYIPWQQQQQQQQQQQDQTKPRLGSRRVYRSEERLRALTLCGWCFPTSDPATSDPVERLVSEGRFERAAAIAVFSLRLRRAIELLQAAGGGGGDPVLPVVAMALSGFSDERPAGLWRELCGGARGHLASPYLRAVFSFLTAETDNYDAVLKEEGVAVIDRVAFACLYLPDHKLSDYIDSLTRQLTEAGKLEGLLLTGVTPRGLDLLENYVAVTADVQTASCVAIMGLPERSLRDDPRLNMWIDSYRNLLDIWRLWHQRAQFDVFMNSCDSKCKTQPQVYVSCTFCGKSVGCHMGPGGHKVFTSFMGFGGGGGAAPGGGPLSYTRQNSQHGGGKDNVNISNSFHNHYVATMCPGCRKPLPRCALCLVHMGTPQGYGIMGQPPAPPGSLAPLLETSSPGSAGSTVAGAERRSKLAPFKDWFTWCQTCRHGGHAGHLAQWFCAGRSECPVTGCTCRCRSLDDDAAGAGPTLPQTEDGVS